MAEEGETTENACRRLKMEKFIPMLQNKGINTLGAIRNANMDVIREVGMTAQEFAIFNGWNVRAIPSLSLPERGERELDESKIRLMKLQGAKPEDRLTNAATHLDFIPKAAIGAEGVAMLMSRVSAVGEAAPLVGAVFVAAGIFIRILQDVKIIKENCILLANRIISMLETLNALVKLNAENPAVIESHLQDKLIRLGNTITEASKFLDTYSSRGMLKRLFRSASGSDATEFEKHDSKLREIQQDLILALGSENLRLVIEGQKRTEQAFRDLGQKIQAPISTDVERLQAAISDMKELSNQQQTFINTTAVVSERVQAFGGPEAVLADSAKLDSLSEEFGVATESLRMDLIEALDFIKLQLEVVKSELDNGMHKIIKQPAVRYLWKTYLSGANESISTDIFFQAIENYLEEKEKLRPQEIMQLMSVSVRKLLVDLLSKDRQTIQIVTVSKVFAPTEANRSQPLSGLLLSMSTKNFDGVNKDNQLAAIGPVPKLIGRENERTELARLTASTDLIWVYGGDGVGKSALVATFAADTIKSTTSFTDVYYVSVQGQTIELASVNVLQVIDPTLPREDAVASLLTWISNTTRRSLIVLDKFNFTEENGQAMEKWLSDVRYSNKARLVTIIITSQGYYQSNWAAFFQVGLLTPDNAEKLLRSIQSDPSPELVQQVKQSRNPDDIIKLARASRRATQAQVAVLTPVATANITLQSEAIRIVCFPFQFDEEAAHAVLGAHNIGQEAPLESVKTLVQSLVAEKALVPSGGFLQLADELVSPVVDDQAFQRYLGYYLNVLSSAVQASSKGHWKVAIGLIDRSYLHLSHIFLKIDLPVWLLPHLTRTLNQAHKFLQTRWSDKELEQFYARVAAAVETAKGRSLPERFLISAWAKSMRHPEEAEKDLPAEFTPDPALLVDVTRTVQYWRTVQLRSQREFEQAFAVVCDSYHRTVKAVGEKHVYMAAVLSSLGVISFDLGKSECVGYLQQAVEIFKVQLGENHPDTVDCVFRLATILARHNTNPQQTLSTFQRVLVSTIAIYGEYHRKTAAVYNNLANIENSDDADDASRRLAYDHFNKSLEIRLRVCGVKDTETAESYGNLGVYLLKIREYDAALERFQCELDIHEQCHGHEHYSTWSSHYHIGRCLSNLNRLDEAEFSFKTALRICQKHNSLRHIGEIALAMCDLYMVQSEFDKAEQSAQLAVSSFTTAGSSMVSVAKEHLENVKRTRQQQQTTIANSAGRPPQSTIRALSHIQLQHTDSSSSLNGGVTVPQTPMPGTPPIGPQQAFQYPPPPHYQLQHQQYPNVPAAYPPGPYQQQQQFYPGQGYQQGQLQQQPPWQQQQGNRFGSQNYK